MKRLGLLLSLLLLSGCASSPDPGPDPTPKPASIVSVECKATWNSHGRLKVELRGTCPFPEDAFLKIRVFQLVEQDERGRLDSVPELRGSGSTMVENGVFLRDQDLEMSAPIRITISLQDELQEKAVQAAIRGKYAPRQWTFDFPVFDVSFLPRLAEDLASLTRMTGEVRALLRSLEAACGSEAYWAEHSKALERDIVSLRRRVEGADFRRLYPAAQKDLLRAMYSIGLACPCFFWNEDRSFGGSFDPWPGKWVPGPDGTPFAFDRTAVFVDQVPLIAGREYALWIVKGMRKLGQRDALLVTAARQGPELAKTLETADLTRAETELRGKAQPESSTKFPPTPKFFLDRGMEKVEEARKLLKEADRLWERADDKESPALYKRLLKEYPTILDGLGVRVRVTHRARDAGE